MTASDSKDDPIVEEAMDWLLRLEAAPHDKAAQAELSAWLDRSAMHQKAYRSVTRMWRLAADLPPDYAERARAERLRGGPRASQRAVQAHVLPRERRGGAKGGAAFRHPIAVAGVAAALVACLVLFLVPSLQYRLQADHATGVAEVLSVTLEDGSELQLAAESAVAVDVNGGQRRVTLIAGQAFFDVTQDPGRPFTVEADGLTVTVTGTAFAIGRSRDALSVAVAEGAVQVVAARNRDSVFRLALGERLTMTSATGRVSRSQIRPTDIAAWRQGQMIVEATPLADVIEEIGRYHNGAIWLEDAALGQRRITGVFSLTDPIAALEAAADTQGAEVVQFTPYFLVVRSR